MSRTLLQYTNSTPHGRVDDDERFALDAPSLQALYRDDQRRITHSPGSLKAPLAPANEARRLDSLHRYDLLDTLPDQALDDLTALAAHICDVPIALISLVDGGRQWFKSKIGTELSETARELSFCGHAILDTALFVVPDASVDDRFADNPMVTGEPHMRFYAGAPLLTPEGDALGTLCVFDRVPRQLSDSQASALLALGRQVMAQLTLRRRTRELAESESRLLRVFRECPVGVAVHRWSDRTFVDVNAAFTSIFGWERAEVLGHTTIEMQIVGVDTAQRLRAMLGPGRVIRDAEVCLRTRDGALRNVIMATVLTELRHEPHTITTYVDITARKAAAELLRESATFAQSTVDALTLSLCVLDANGVVLATNVAWRAFAGLHDDSALRAGTGDDFLHVCDSTSGAESLDAMVLAAGVRVAIEGGGATFEMEYACHSPLDQQCLVARVTRFADRGSVRVVISCEDVTLRKHAETLAHRLAAIVESSDDAIIGKDMNGIITSWNGGATRIFGYSAHEMLGTSIMRLLPFDRQDEESRILERIRRGESVPAFDTLRRTKDGRLLDVSVTASPIKDSMGRVVGASKVASDITARKRAEGVLGEREEQLRLYARHSPAAVAMLDRDMNYLVVSDRWMEAYRLGDASIVGRNHYEVFPDLPARFVATNQRSLEGAVSRSDEDSFRHPDGTTEWIRWETRPWHQADGAIGGIIIFTEVLTERKQRDAAQRASDERMRFALENAEVGIWDYDFITGVVEWSETLEAQYGMRPGSFPGTLESVLERVYPDDRESVIETLRSAVATGVDFTMQSRALWADGTVRWLSGAGRIQHSEQGLPLRGVGISMDISERHALEEQSQQAQKMEAIGRLAGGVAHDFNNLLTVILGYCDILLADLAPGDDRRGDVTEIQKAGTRASSFTRQLLAFSRKEIIEPALLDINVITTDMRTMLSRLIGENVKIVLTLAPKLSLILADRGQIDQVLMNLAVNARDAMRGGGTLTIETKNVVLGDADLRQHPAMHAGAFVALIVSDTGSGMRPEVLSRMFEPFFTTKDVGQGTGLGMATVHGIVARCGGRIDVVSELGTGTTFTVYFPSVASPGSVVELAKPAVRSRVATQTILLVEDEEGLREVARKLLERHGYVVLVAANAAEAIREFASHESIDLVLTDVIMPGTSGPELIRQLVAKRPLLKVMYMSGYTEDAIVQHGVLKPGISYLNKPFSFDSLGDKIRQVLEQ